MVAEGKSLSNPLEKRNTSERRWGKRRPAAALAVYYWDGGTPKPHGVRDLSSSGIYLYTEELLYPGAMLLLTMQRQDMAESSPDQWIAVHALVVRRDPGGVALSFVFPRTRESHLSVIDLANGATRNEMAAFLTKLFAPATAPVQAKTATVQPQRLSVRGSADCSENRTIQASKVCVCNLTRENLLSREMSVIDTGHEPAEIQVDGLSRVSPAGVWLSPFRGLPSGTGRSPFDLIFLDDSDTIVEWVEQLAATESSTFDRKHASALLVPSGTIALSRIELGDQLRICSPDSRAAALADPLYSISDPTHNKRTLRKLQPHCLRDAASFASEQHNAGVADQLRQADALSDTSSSMLNHPARGRRFLRWLFPTIKPRDRRRAKRTVHSQLIAFYNAGGEPKALKVADVSSNGLYLCTDERWLPGTRIVITLQKESCSGQDAADWSRVESKVIRCGKDGVGFEFVIAEDAEILRGNESEPGAFQHFLSGFLDSGQGFDTRRIATHMVH